MTFVITDTKQGRYIVPQFCEGCGGELVSTGEYWPAERDLIKRVLSWCRRKSGDGVIAIDGGANCGAHTIAWAMHMTGWGEVLAVEAQEPIFYALAGSIMLNNCLNVRARWAAITDKPGVMQIPTLDYSLPSAFSGFSLRKTESMGPIGQPIDYDKTVPVPAISIDSLNLQRLDFIKLDLELMDLEALIGGERTIMAQRPIIYVEAHAFLKDPIREWLEPRDYSLIPCWHNYLAIDRNDFDEVRDAVIVS